MTEPKTISELMKLVMEESKKGNINNAIIYLNEAIEIEPHDARFYISRGTFKEKEKNMNMKIVDLQIAWQKDFVFKINPITLDLGYLWISDIEQKTKNYIWDNNEWIET